MKIKAEIVPYSGVVGSSVMLMAPEGHCIGMVAFMCQSDEMRGKDFQENLARIISDAINERGEA